MATTSRGRQHRHHGNAEILKRLDLVQAEQRKLRTYLGREFKKLLAAVGESPEDIAALAKLKDKIDRIDSPAINKG